MNLHVLDTNNLGRGKGMKASVMNDASYENQRKGSAA